jgi:hypothetical protein
VQATDPQPFRTNRPTDPERMDAPDVPQAEIARSFRFIRMVNRWFGGTSACMGVLRREARTWPPDRPMRWIDLGTGAADIPLAVDRWAATRGLAVECVAVDNHVACLQVARAAVGSHPRIRVMEGDALDPNLARDLLRSGARHTAFDYAHAGMFLHHLRDEDVVRVLRTMGGLATRRIIWNDLLRAPWSERAVRLATLGQSEMVRYDALLSVRKGFTPSEARAAAEAAGLEEVEVRSNPLVGRFVLTARSAAKMEP